jgi:NAD(P)-dependent dehydrogenase (short-subunit alcohol dehydrogenase family)
VNNAGISGKLGPAEWMHLDYYKRALDVNTLGIVDVTMKFLPLIKKARGRIVITSSASGRFAHPLLNPYNVSKYGAEAFGDGLRRSMRPFGITTSLIEPGMHETPIATHDAVTREMTSAWNNASPEVKEEFGDDYLEKVVDQLHQLQVMIRSSKVSDVVDSYEDALLSRYPRARYVVGLDANFLFLPLQALPECISDWLLEVISPKGPTPAALRK